MKITVKSKEDKVNINIIIPMNVIITLIRISKPFIKRYSDNEFKLGKVNYKFKYNDIDVIIKALKYLKKEHKGLSIVDVEEENGDIVKIKV